MSRGSQCVKETPNVFSGDEVLGPGFWVEWGVYVVWSGMGGEVRGCSRVGNGDGGSWVLLLSVEDPFALSSFLFALCIDISVEDRGDFSGDSVYSFTFLWRSLNVSCIYIFYILYSFISLYLLVLVGVLSVSLVVVAVVFPSVFCLFVVLFGLFWYIFIMGTPPL